ncbi:hypothetical protein B0H11DRAFT_2204849 [Mycena galericulata]|nr:hypothetical protein B0H11DRAFT_2204849 [Mycena galericulata]
MFVSPLVSASIFLEDVLAALAPERQTSTCVLEERLPRIGDLKTVPESRTNIGFPRARYASLLHEMEDGGMGTEAWSNPERAYKMPLQGEAKKIRLIVSLLNSVMQAFGRVSARDELEEVDLPLQKPKPEMNFQESFGSRKPQSMRGVKMKKRGEIDVPDPMDIGVGRTARIRRSS